MTNFSVAAAGQSGQAAPVRAACDLGEHAATGSQPQSACRRRIWSRGRGGCAAATRRLDDGVRTTPRCRKHRSAAAKSSGSARRRADAAMRSALSAVDGGRLRAGQRLLGSCGRKIAAQASRHAPSVSDTAIAAKIPLEILHACWSLAPWRSRNNAREPPGFRGRHH